MEFKDFSLHEIRECIARGETTPEAVYQYFLARAEQYQEVLNVFNTVPSSEPTHQGIPIAVKDVFCEDGVRTTASSLMLADFVPPYESTVTDRLKQAGFVGFGKTALDEFAMGSSGESSAFGVTKNPWDITRIPWGSSSGSAAAVAAGLVPAALGTDTGGSIRQPASMCGIVGFKPSYGRNSRFGVIAMASSLDCPGYFTRTVQDAGLLYAITAGHDPKDATSINAPAVLDQAIWSRSDLNGIRVGIPKEYFIDGIDPGVRSTIDHTIDTMRSLGAEIVEVSLPHTELGVAVYYTICPAEVASNMARYDGIRYGSIVWDGGDIALNRSAWLGAEVQRRSIIGSFVLSSGFYDAYYKKASAVRELIRDDFRKAFEAVDVIVTPTAPHVAWKIGQKITDPMELYLEDIFTIPASLAGLPGLSIPIGYAPPADDPSVILPVGLQILWPVMGDARVLEIGHVIEQAMKPVVRSRTPEIWD